MDLSYAGPILVLSFLLVTYAVSAYEKMTDWKTTIEDYSQKYEGTLLHIIIKPLIIFILGFEIIVTAFCAMGIYDILSISDSEIANYAFALSSILCIILLLGLRMLKDYEGASRIAIYFLISTAGLFWAQSIFTM
jgi:hypothetical protein